MLPCFALEMEYLSSRMKPVWKSREVVLVVHYLSFILRSRLSYTEGLLGYIGHYIVLASIKES